MLAHSAAGGYGHGMAWHWQLLDSEGQQWPGELGSEQSFPSQSDAETWLGETWRELRDHGVSAVVLFEHERTVYGPMSLESA